MTDGDWAATRPETACLVLAASAGPDEYDALTVRVRRERGYVGREGRSGLMSVLDVPRRAAPARLMAAAQAAGLHWAVRAGLNEAGLLTTVVTRTGQGGTVTFRVPDPAPRGGQLVSMWIDRNPSGPGTPRTPALLLLHTTPDVVRASAVLASGGRRHVRLSPAIEDFRIRFAAVPLPDEDPLTSVEIQSRLRGVQLIELWRPPRRPNPVG